MKIPVKTLWHNQVGVRARFIMDCKRTGELLFIEHDGRLMSIPAAELETRKVGISEKPVKDKFGRALDYLYYYKWEPDPAQQKIMF